MSLEASIWASKLDLRLEGVDGEGEGGEGEGEGKISPMCESIGHRPLRGRCPKGESNSQFLGVRDFDVFSGGVVEKYQKRHKKTVFHALSNNVIRILLQCLGAEIYRFLLVHFRKNIL